MHKMVVPKNGWLLYEYLWFIYGESTTNWEPQGSHRLLDLAMDGLKGINWTCVEMCPINGGFHSHGVPHNGRFTREHRIKMDDENRGTP